VSTGGGGLEVYGDGSGSPLLVDLHSCLRPWYGAHYSAGAVTLRHDASHRHSVFQDREEENEDDDEQENDEDIQNEKEDEGVNEHYYESDCYLTD